jgi:hypothetical protein
MHHPSHSPLDVVHVVGVVRLALQQCLYSSLVYVPVPVAVVLLLSLLLCWTAALGTALLQLPCTILILVPKPPAGAYECV